jgi:hypothetical protein
VSGELSLKGQNANEVLVKTTAEEGLKFDQDGDTLMLDCPGDCTVYVPHQAVIRVEHITGGARVKSLDGKLSFGSIDGELSLRDVGGVEIENVGSDLSARRIRGSLTVENVGRAAIVRDVDGQFHAQQVGAHLNLRDVSGGVVASVGGNAEVFLSPVPWQTYAIQAGGNLSCRLEEDANARVAIRSGAQKIRLSLPDLTQTITEPEFTAELGESGPVIRLEAGGSVDLRSRASGWESFGVYGTTFTAPTEDIDRLAEQIEAEATSQIDALTNQIDAYIEQMEFGLEKNLSDAQRTRILNKMQRVQEKTQRASERARQKLERKLDVARRKLDRESGRSWSPVVPPVPPVPPSPARRFVWPVSAEEQEAAASEPASEEERLMILRMLEQKQITAAEAEQLLAALDGE